MTVYYRTHFQWNGSLANPKLFSTNYLDDGAAYYVNGARVGLIRMPNTYVYSTPSSGQPAVEGAPDFLQFTNVTLNIGDNVIAAEVHQTGNTSSDDVFGMLLSAVQLTTNVITTTTTGIPVVLNEVLASNHSMTNGAGATPDWIELFNPSTNAVNLGDVSLSDDSNVPRKFVFPSGTTIAAGGSW